MNYEKQFAACTTLAEVKDLQWKIKSEIALASAGRQAEINAVLDAPYHDEAKRWKHGDKVFFGKSDNRSYMSFEDRISITKDYDIKAGQWCRVWEYQSRKKVAWLCHPGKKLEWDNIIEHGFTLRDLRNAEISRVEIDIRKKLQESKA